MERSFLACFNHNRLILTEGAIGLRIEREYHIKPDPDVMYAGLIYDAVSRNVLSALYGQYLQIARKYSLPIMLMTNTRRANRDRVIHSPFDKNIMRDYTRFLFDLIGEYSCEAYVGGMMGCKGNAYSGEEGITAAEAVDFHSWQAKAFESSKPDFMFAGIMPCLPEAIGMAMVLEKLGLPYIISLMVGREGRLLDGHSIHEAIYAIDGATSRKPLCYMTNCIHPSVLREALSQEINRTPLVRERFCGIQANASVLEACKLDQCKELETTDADELIQHFLALHREFPLKIYGGCCGTDHTPIEQIASKMTCA